MRTLLILCLLAIGAQSQDITFSPSTPVRVEGQSVSFTCSLPGGQVPNLERRLPDGLFQIINAQTDPRVSVVVDGNAVFTIQNLNSSQDSGSVWRCSLGALTSPLATLTVQIQEPVVFGLEPQLLSVTEGAAAEVCVELLAGNITDPVTVNVRTLEGLRQTDFVIGLSSIVFVAGDARKCSQVQTFDDSAFEETETFQIMLNSTSSNVEILLNRSSADILIADNDVVLLGFVEPFKTVPESAGTVQLCVELQGGELQLPVRVRVQSNDITAEAGSDYSEVLQLLIFHIGGNTTQCFNVEIIDDASAETDETFRLSLATESVAVVAYSEAQLTIVDNEIPLMLSFRNDTPLVVGNDVTLAFAANMPLASAECAITGSKQGSRDCTDGFAEFKNINPSRRGVFTIDVTAVGTSGQSAKLTSTFRSETAGDCSAHLINEGLTVGASGAVSVQWQATGPTAANRTTDFRCTVDDNAPVNCVSPYEVEVGAGEHTLTVRPSRNELCRRIIPLMLGPFQI